MTKVRKEENDRIRDERDRLRVIFENLVDGVFITNRDHQIEFMNQDLIYQFGDGLGMSRILWSLFNQLQTVP